MPRVAGIDLGTLTLDVCGLDDGHVFLEQSIPTATALAEPESVVSLLAAAGPLDFVVGPSGYGLPLRRIQDVSDSELQLASLAIDQSGGGIRGFRTLLRTLARSAHPVWLTPGVIHLASVPAHRKVNRIDMGTADKVCACALAIHDRARHDRCLEEDVSLILLEMGGAFTAAIAIENGRIVDGIGGTSGPMGLEAVGALDGEVACIAGTVTKAMLFTGGAHSVAGPDATRGMLREEGTDRSRVAWNAYIESAVKAVAALAVTVPGVRRLVLSGRLAADSRVHEELTRRLAPLLGKLTVAPLAGFSRAVKQGAQGAALIADGLAGGHSKTLVDTLDIRHASGTVLDHLYVITADAARARLGITP
jgi:predicted butyrate kinase (DUF1464 family)